MVFNQSEYIKKYQQIHKERINEQHRLLWIKNREKELERDKLYRLRHKGQISKYHEEYRKEKRLQLYDIISGRVCIKCGFSDMRALQLDHINGRGCFTNLNMWGRKTISDRAINYYISHPDKARQMFQILCANCNQIKKVEKKECLRPYKEKSE